MLKCKEPFGRYLSTVGYASLNLINNLTIAIDVDLASAKHRPIYKYQSTGPTAILA